MQCRHEGHTTSVREHEKWKHGWTDGEQLEDDSADAVIVDGDVEVDTRSMNAWCRLQLVLLVLSRCCLC